MNRKTAEILVQDLTSILSGHNLTTTAITPLDRGRPEVRTNQKFNKAYFVEHDNGECVVAISDSYGVMAGSDDWSIDPDRRTIHAATINGYGETLRFSWTIADDKTGEMWQVMREADDRLRHANRH